MRYLNQHEVSKQLTPSAGNHSGITSEKEIVLRKKSIPITPGTH